ncbi:MAG: response regulator [Treponema sp.]|jgi:signal transduction histidine kinase/DNA-binding response OmpR family regulator|nr:response regulator [Treponema sp.]
MQSSPAANYDKARESWYYTIANIIVSLAVFFYVMFRLSDAVHRNNFSQFLPAAILGAAALLLLFIIQVPLKKILDAAFFCPFALYIIFNAMVILNHEGKYFFTVYLGICCLATVYNNRRRLEQYLLVTNIINIVLIYFRVPLETPGWHAPYSELVVHGAALIFSSLLLYLIVRSVNSRGLEAVRTTDTFITLLNAVPRMIVTVDSLNRITNISKSMAAFARIENPALALGRPALDLFRDMDVKLMIGEMLISDEPVSAVKEIEINGEVRHLTIISDKLGNHTGRFIDIDDVSDINRARIDAEQATVAKSRFLATMSHEIRTPMNAIIGMSDLMPTENLSPLQKGYFEEIKGMSKSLLTIINDILDFSKIEAGKFKLADAHYNVHVLFDNIASMCEFLAQGKNLEFRRSFDASVPEILYGDEVRVRQIFTNIVNNAVKYTQEGYVSFKVFLGRPKAAGADGEADYLVAEIQDSGIGIKEEDIPKLFGSFQQLDDRKNSGILGTGLGLAITKNLISMMNGYIEVESVYGFGSTFTVFLPLIRGDPGKVASAEDAPVVIAKEGVRALVVDDGPVNLTVALAFLAKHNINAETASGGFEAVEKVRAAVEEGRPYDLVFMDHMMPDLDGTDATERIRGLGEGGDSIYRTMPILALSANVAQGAKEAFLASGMNGLVSKPIEPSALNGALKNYLPEEKYTLADPGRPKPAVKKTNRREEGFEEELAKIEGLNSIRGLHYAADNFETYVLTLKQFSAGMEKGIAALRDSLAGEDWKLYTVHIHAYKGICATIGAQALSDWARKLERASKSEDRSLCAAETGAFCAALESLNAALRGTSLLAERPEEDKRGIGAADMAAKLAAFADSCGEGGLTRIKAAAGELETLRLEGAPPEFAAALKEVLDLARSLDYDEAAEKARELAARLK